MKYIDGTDVLETWKGREVLVVVRVDKKRRGELRNVDKDHILIEHPEFGPTMIRKKDIVMMRPLD